MANVTKNSFRESNRHTTVIFQRGRDVLDFELNEFQDILRTQQYRALVAESGGLNPGSNDDGYLVVGEGEDNEVIIKAGTLFCDGIPIVLLEDVVYSALETNDDVSPVINTIYLAVSEQEVPDPAQVPQLGETSRRMKLIVEIRHVEGTDLPEDSPQPIWQAGTRYFRLAEITRAPGVAAIAADDVEDKRFRLPAYTIAKYVGQYSLTPPSIGVNQNNYSPPGISDAFVIRLNPTASVAITGMTADVQYRKKTIINLGSDAITFSAEDAASLAANRFANSTTLYPGGAVDVTYDTVLSRWRFINPGSASALPDEVLISPPAVVGGGSSIADYNPTGWSTATVVRLSVTSGAVNFTGFSALVTDRGRRKLLINDSTMLITLQSHGGLGASADANRVASPYSEPFNLIPGASVFIQYDSTETRWRVVTEGLPNVNTNWTAFQNFLKGANFDEDGASPGSPAMSALSGHFYNLLVASSGDVNYSIDGTNNPATVDRTEYIEVPACNGWVPSLGPLGLDVGIRVVQEEPTVVKCFSKKWKLPRGALLKELRVIVEKGDGAGSNGSLKAGYATYSGTITMLINNNAVTGYTIGEALNINHEFDPSTEMMFVLYTPSDSVTEDAVFSIKVVYGDPGPRSLAG